MGSFRAQRQTNGRESRGQQMGWGEWLVVIEVGVLLGWELTQLFYLL